MNTFNRMIIRLSKKDNHNDIYDLCYELYDTSFLPKWIERYLYAQQMQYPISEPWAFYGFSTEWTAEKTITFLNKHISICNNIKNDMFDSCATTITDQPKLNHLHSLFVKAHGQLDTWFAHGEISEVELEILKSSLSLINQTIHRCESMCRTHTRIRIVYFDLPKDYTYSPSDYELFTHSTDFGGLYTMYANVGKNIESLARDYDNHLGDFVPNLNYSVDFHARFYDDDGKSLQDLTSTYIETNWEEFEKLGYERNSPLLTTGSIKLGQLIYETKQEVLDKLVHYDNVQSVFVY